MSKSDTQSVASLFFPSLKIKDVVTGPLKRFQYFKQSRNMIIKVNLINLGRIFDHFNFPNNYIIILN